MRLLFASFMLLTACQEPPGIVPLDQGRAVPNANIPQTPVRTDNIVQVTEPKVDVLWVIDDSCSMDAEQAKLADNFAAFMEFFVDSGLDYHIGVISTDTASPAKRGRLQAVGAYRWIDTGTPDPVGVFRQMAILGTAGSVDENGRRAVDMALTDPLLSNYNAGFYREEASLHVIVISDENDHSGSVPTRNEFISFLRGLKDDEDRVTFSSIVTPLGGCSTGFEPGTEYIAVTNALGGVTESICTEDWAPVLTELGLQAAGLRTTYYLSELPVPGTIQVTINDGDFVWEGIDADDPAAVCESATCWDWRYQGMPNAITFLHHVPSANAEVVISYEMLSGLIVEEGSDNPLVGPRDTGP